MPDLPGIDLSRLAPFPLTVDEEGGWIGCAGGEFVGQLSVDDAHFYVVARKAAAAMAMGCEAVLNYRNTERSDWYVRYDGSMVFDGDGYLIEARDGQTALALAHDVLTARGVKG